jgi:hypothetical protein
MKLGVEVGQGYLFALPVSPEAIIDMIAVSPDRSGAPSSGSFALSHTGSGLSS